MSLTAFETLPDDANSEVINNRILRIRKEARDLRVLLDSPGWLIVQELIGMNSTAAALEGGGSAMLSVEDVLKHNLVAGRVEGMQQVIRSVSALAEHYKQELIILNAKMKEREHATQTDDSEESGRAGGSEFDSSPRQPELFVPESSPEQLAP